MAAFDTLIRLLEEKGERKRKDTGPLGGLFGTVGATARGFADRRRRGQDLEQNNESSLDLYKKKKDIDNESLSLTMSKFPGLRGSVTSEISSPNQVSDLKKDEFISKMPVKARVSITEKNLQATNGQMAEILSFMEQEPGLAKTMEPRFKWLQKKSTKLERDLDKHRDNERKEDVEFQKFKDSLHSEIAGYDENYIPDPNATREELLTKKSIAKAQSESRKAEQKTSGQVDTAVKKKSAATKQIADRIVGISRESIAQLKGSLEDLEIPLEPLKDMKQWRENVVKLYGGRVKAGLRLPGSSDRLASYEGIRNDFKASLARIYGGSGRVAVMIIKMAGKSLPTYNDFIKPDMALNKIAQTVWDSVAIARSEAGEPPLDNEAKLEIIDEVKNTLAAPKVSFKGGLSDEEAYQKYLSAQGGK